MSRDSGRGANQLSLFLARGLRAAHGRVNEHLLVSWPLSLGKADRLLLAPQDLRTADGTRASEIYAGRFVFAGKVVICDGRSPFEIARRPRNGRPSCSASAGCAICAPPNSAITRANARALVDEWISAQGAQRRARLAHRRAGAARDLLDQPGAADPAGCRRAVLSPLHAQPDATGALPAPHGRRGARRRAAAAGRDRAHATPRSAWPARQRHIRAATKRLSDELERQILPDGGHISRNPGALIELLVDLLPLRTAFTAAQHRAAAAAPQRHRPHDADAALLPPRRRQLRAVQRHGPDRRPICSRPSSPMTTPAARRSRMRRIPAISGWRAPARWC